MARKAKQAGAATPPQPEVETPTDEEVAGVAAVEPVAAAASEDDVACCGQAAAIEAAQAREALAPEPGTFDPAVVPAGYELVSFVGPGSGRVTFFDAYTGCAGCAPVAAHPSDVDRLISTGQWVRYVAPAAPEASGDAE